MLPAQLAGLEMHGTGTPLGDPIETGAAFAVLSSDLRPLQLSAAKSLTGHAEPAAGMVGIVNAASILIERQTSLLPQLRTINPHVSSLLGNEAKYLATPVYLARQRAGQVCQQESCAVGVSAFAFQGTNAHSILTTQDTALSQAVEGAENRLQRGRFWYLGPQYSILHKAAVPTKGQISFSCSLQMASMAFLQDHCIQGSPLFPGAGMFDMALSAGDCVMTENCLTTLSSVSISQPLPMNDLAEIAVHCNVNVLTGKLEVRSARLQAGFRTHLTASLGRNLPFIIITNQDHALVHQTLSSMHENHSIWDIITEEMRLHFAELMLN